MFIFKIIVLLVSFFSFVLPALTYPLDAEAESEALITTEDLAALAIINDPTPKFFANITITNETTMKNMTAQVTYVCDTTSGSPSVHWLREISGELRGLLKHGKCRQNSDIRMCYTFIHAGNAAASICGNYGKWVPCDYAGYAGFWITDYCAWNGLAGGRFLLEDGDGTWLAFHKP